MAIIKRSGIVPKQTQSSDKPEPKDAVPEKIDIAEPVNEQKAKKPPKQVQSKRPRSIVVSIAGLLVGLGIPILGYIVVSQTGSDTASSSVTQENEDPPKQPIAVLPLDLAKLVKTASLFDLAKREFEVNFVSLNEARTANSSAEILGALEIILDKNRKERGQFADQLAASLVEIHSVYQSNPAGVRAAFETAKQENIDKGSIVELLNFGMQAIIDAPNSGGVDRFMRGAIKERI